MNSHGSPKFSSPNARGGSRRAPSTLAHPENPFLLGTAVAVELYFVLGLHVGVSLLIAALLVLRFKIHFLKIAIMGVPCWVLLGYMFGVGVLGRVASVAVEAPLVWLLHELLRPTARDRNLLPEGFEDPARPGSLAPFPTLDHHPSVRLSVILPVCCEAEWVSSAGDAIVRSLQARRNCAPGADSAFELVIVDRASSDHSYAAALALVETYGLDTVRALRLSHDHGVGRALREGALRARGEQIMLLLRPAANCFDQVEALLSEMDWLRAPERDGGALLGTTTNTALAPVGERKAPDERSKTHSAEQEGWESGWTRVWLVNLPRLLWDFFVKLLFPQLTALSGTQWAFALLPRRAAPAVLGPECSPALALAWPVELVLRLHALGLALVEVPVLLSPADLRRSALPLGRTLRLIVQLLAVCLIGGLVPGRYA